MVVVCGSFVTGFVAAVSMFGLVIGFLVMAGLGVDTVGFLVGNRVVSVDVAGFNVELGTVCDKVVASGRTLGIKIHSGGYSVFTIKQPNKTLFHSNWILFRTVYRK